MRADSLRPRWVGLLLALALLTTGCASLTPPPGRGKNLSYTPRAPEVELESFSGLIQLASREVVERALELRRAKLDSLRALRGMARAHRFEYKMRFHEKKSEKSQDDEDRDKDKK